MVAALIGMLAVAITCIFVLVMCWPQPTRPENRYKSRDDALLVTEAWAIFRRQIGARRTSDPEDVDILTKETNSMIEKWMQRYEDVP